MKIIIIVLFNFVILFSQNKSDIEMCKKGIIYPEDHAIQYFDPYLLKMQSKVPDEFDESLKRLSVFLHQSLFIDEGVLKPCLLPLESNFDADREDTLYITLPSSESIWRFHDGRELHIKDIYYSIRYAISTELFLPSMYKDKVKIIFDEPKEQIVLIYDSKYNKVNIKKHFKDLIVLPHEHTKDFVESNFNKKSEGYEKLKEWIRKKIGTQFQSDITNINSAGPFKISAQQKGGNLLLEKFESYEEKSLKSNVNIIKVLHEDIKTQWWDKLLDHKVNIVPELLNINNSTENFRVKSRESTEIASLVINYKSKKSNQLKNRKFREAITYLINKEDYKFSQLNNRAHLINGPLIKSDTGHSDDVREHEYDIVKFEKIMKDLGYKKEYNSDAKTEIYKHQDTGDWAEFSFLFRSGQGVPSNRALICRQLSRDFIENGIWLKPDAKSIETTFQSSLVKGDFDFVYLVTKINSGESIEKYYGRNGSKNYGRYYPSDDLQNDLEECDKNCHNDFIEKKLRKTIYEKIANDYANIFLWSPFSFYAYNEDYFRVKSKSVLPKEQFFNLPHKPNYWKMINY